MRKHWTSLALVLALTGLVACGGGESAEQNAGGNDASATEQTTPAPENGGATAETASTSIEGSLGCGHCNHQIGTSCSAAVQTADGTVYILEGMSGGDEPFDKRFDKTEIKVVGQVSERDGVNYVEVASYEML